MIQSWLAWLLWLKPKEAELAIHRRWLWVYTLVLGTGIFSAFSGWGYDDPFIIYRYADNLRHGLGFVYNPGERVLSSTTPLFTLLLALLSTIWADLPRLAVLIGGISLAAGGVFLWDLTQSWEAPLAGWAGLLIYPTFPLLLSSLSSEVPLYLAFCLAAFAFYARRRYRSAAALCALATLTRPDGALITALLAAAYIFQQAKTVGRKTVEKHSIQAVLIYSGLVLPWVLFAWFYFGSPVPVTLAVKQQQGLMAISTRFAPGFLDVLAAYARHWQYWLQSGLALAGLWLAVVHRRNWLLLLAWTVAYFCAYWLLGVSRYYWYYAFLVPGWVVLAGLGLSAIQRTMHRLGWRLSYLVPLGLVAVLALAQIGSLLRLRQLPDNRLSIYQAIGEWLAANTDPQSKVGMLEVGIMGYYSNRTLVDFSGLIQPQVARQFSTSTTYSDSARWAVENYQPETLVLHDGLFPWLEKVYIPQHCRPVKHFAGIDYGYSSDMTVFACPR